MIAPLLEETRRDFLYQEIAGSQRRCTDSLREEYDREIWGNVNNIVSRRFKASEPPQILSREIEKDSRARLQLFPSEMTINGITQQVQKESVPLFREIESSEGVRRIKERKATGPDGILPEIVKLVVF